MTVRELLEATAGRLVRGALDDRFTGVSTDSRSVQAGDLFVPLRGERFDGHQFIGEALAARAAGFLLERAGAGWLPSDEGGGAFAVAVEDTLVALQRLAAFYRRRFAIPVVGVTGSVGKTTTKDLIAAVLGSRWRTVATKGNLNNEIGLPLTVFRLNSASEAACFELGMRGLGQIRTLAEIIRPTVGVVTNVGETHLELLGSQENIARAKAELIEALPPDGVAVLNADDPRVLAMAQISPARVVCYGLLRPGERPEERRLDVAGEAVESHGVRGVSLTLLAGEQRQAVKLPIPGVHNARNALAAAAVGVALGLTLAGVARGLEQVRLTEMRLQVERGREGFLLINDAYNASPASVRAALELLVESRSGGQAVAVLGDMLELGEGTAEAHRKIGEYAAQLGVDRLVGVGPLSANTVRGAQEAGLGLAEAYETTAAAARALVGTLRPKDVVLVKGSRGMHMEEIVQELGRVGAGRHG